MQNSNEILQFICFKLGEEEYALNILNIREVIAMRKITPVPQMPDFTLGIVNIRGEIIPVFDLRKKFFIAEKKNDRFTRILVADVDNTVISFVVDEILDNIRFAPSQIDPPPPVKMKINKNCIYGIGELSGRMIIILDFKKIHQDIKHSLLELA